MKSLSFSEARVIQALLAVGPASELDRQSLADVPRSTFQSIRTRAEVNGWIQESIVPSLRAAKAPSITFRLEQPFAERRDDILRRHYADPRIVLLWASPETVFTARFNTTAEPNSNTVSAGGHIRTASSGLRSVWEITPGNAPVNIPIYFDYAAAFGQQIGVPGVTTTPAGLPRPDSGMRAPSDRIVREVLATLPLREKLGLSGVAHRLSYPVRAARRLGEANWISRRTSPVYSAMPPFRGHKPDQLVFLFSRPRAGNSLAQLMEALPHNCGINPFLAVGSTERVLLGMLAPRPPAAGIRRSPVIQTMTEFLSEIEVVREQISSFAPIVNHRYSRLLT
jgi:hypothetical protein